MSNELAIGVTRGLRRLGATVTGGVAWLGVSRERGGVGECRRSGRVGLEDSTHPTLRFLSNTCSPPAPG